MSASMAEGMATILAEHQGTYVAEDPDGYQWCIRCGGCEKALKGGKGNTAWRERDALLAAHQAEVLAANGYGKLEEAQARAYDKGYGHGRHDGEHHDSTRLSATPRPEKNRRNPYRRPE